METTLIILRGNSGSGKSSIARALRLKMGYGTALIEQDYIRRILLREKERPNFPNIELIAQNATFALAHGYNVILEGILHEVHYGDMLRELIANHSGKTLVYYFDVSFEETLKRHKTKPNAHEFGETEMRKWYNPTDLLKVKNEQIIPENSTFDQTLECIFKDISS